MEFDSRWKYSGLAPSTERYFAGLNTPGRSNDPAENVTFDSLSAQYLRFDTRDDQALLQAIEDDTSPLERERAMWEYADRHGQESIAYLLNRMRAEIDNDIRQGLLWLIQKTLSMDDIHEIGAYCKDKDAEVADWACLLFREMTGKDLRPAERRIAVSDDNPFDQTLPLRIAGYAIATVPSVGLVRVVLSPLWFEQIMGRVMACTRQETFGSNLIIEKRIRSYHPDGTDHFEIYKFNGLSSSPFPGVTEHIYECQSRHPFYLSGTVEDKSLGIVDDVNVVLARKANPVIVRPKQHLLVGSANRGSDGRWKELVESVRGKYYGFAFANIDRLFSSGFQIHPGTIQLTSPTHPEIGSMTNLFLYGTFKGKLSDLDGDGVLDANTERCHSTLNGDLDYSLCGLASRDPFA
ncbi:PBS lyase [Rhizobium sophoriradicis]|uniref:hypothetical protein n=1 Tax=Rhizobium sophoriradicis TaxID=1535245 RepID=UPI00098F5C54|nr:hypothetical protein [Rhizobium sophoriradicis]RSB86872.1 PBS lyase [Rhizobium sophoriradicis]